MGSVSFYLIFLVRTPNKILCLFVQFCLKGFSALVANDFRVVQIYLELVVAAGTRNYFAALNELLIEESLTHMLQMHFTTIYSLLALQNRFLYLRIIIVLGEMMAEKKLIGNITHFFPKPSVAVVELEGVLKAGDKILIERSGESFEQVVSSMQIEHENVQEAKPGDAIGLKVDQPTKQGAKVYKVIE